MRYSKELTLKLIEDYTAGIPVEQIAENLNVPQKSVIAKLASLNLYKKRPYLTKLGEPSVKKSSYIEKLSELLNISLENLDSLEKVNKRILITIVAALESKSAAD